MISDCEKFFREQKPNSSTLEERLCSLYGWCGEEYQVFNKVEVCDFVGKVI